MITNDLRPSDLLRIQNELKKLRLWYPPDAIFAVFEGRETYWSLGGKECGVEWPLKDEIKNDIRYAARRCNVDVKEVKWPK